MYFLTNPFKSNVILRNDSCENAQPSFLRHPRYTSRIYALRSLWCRRWFWNRWRPTKQIRGFLPDTGPFSNG